MCSSAQTVLKDLRNLSNIFQPHGTDSEFTQIALCHKKKPKPREEKLSLEESHVDDQIVLRGAAPKDSGKATVENWRGSMDFQQLLRLSKS